ncbi:hypothetical protein M405DRAFT_818789 [Rhizopogon salebrosus TDB-379]|nr:hypothetical protein M405DRAFT_818789 [Rhizopogon salebrosus TDB-379]
MPVDCRNVNSHHIRGSDGNGIQPSYITLYHLALTCRAFKEPVLDASWAHTVARSAGHACLRTLVLNQSQKFHVGQVRILYQGGEFGVIFI